MNNLLLFPARGERPRTAPPDAAVRAEALNIRSSFIVQAPAGSGKTTLLIQRFLKLLADDSVSEPEQVLAITFTNAATAELRDRVLRALAEAKSEEEASGAGVLQTLAATSSSDANDRDTLTSQLASAVLARDAARGWNILLHPQRLNIRTIDSVCAGIARSLPVLSGSGGRLVPADDARPLYREAARRTLLELGSGDAAFDADLRTLLLHRDGNLDNCEALIAEMLALRDQWGELVPLQRRELDHASLDADLLPRLERALELAICNALARLDALFPADLLHDLSELAGHLGHQPGSKGASSSIACCAGLHDAPEPTAEELSRWRAFAKLLLTAQGEWRKERGLTGGHLGFAYDRAHAHHTKLARILDRLSGCDDVRTALCEITELPDATYPAEQWAVAKALFRILSHALVELQLVFAARGQCDFAELALLARAALNTSTGANDLADALGARLQHLLVDEMQDTSNGQYELLRLLTASWDGHSQTLFLVGDPFQSIYLFRQARVERFVHALDTGRLGELPLTPLALTANFRSQGELVQQFNQDFSRIFSPPVTDDAASAMLFVQAQPTRHTSTAAGRVWHLHPQARAASTPAPQLGPTQAQRDAESIAAIAADWLARALPEGREDPWKVAVLVRSRNQLAEVVPALRRKGVPFRAVDIETLRERQEVLDLTAMTRALLHPADRVAALAVLRAPWCGLPLADLHMLTGEDDFSLSKQSLFRVLESRAHLLSAGSQQRLARVRAVFASAVQLRARLTTAQLIERTWRSLGGDAPLTTAELTNARRFFELLDALEQSTGRVDPAQLESRLAQLYAEPDAVPPGSPFVELLTIHKAKGLEWDVVFVPSLERRPAASFSRLLTWSVLDEAEFAAEGNAANILLAPIAARGEEVDMLTRWLKKRHRDREYAENKRLFYVACTRAREEVHLFAAPTTSSSQGLKPGWPDSLLQAAWPAAQPHVASSGGTVDGSHNQIEEGEDIADLAAGAQQPNEDVDGNLQVTDANLIAPVYPTIKRLPLSFDPAARFLPAGPLQRSYSEVEAPSSRRLFARPEGSFAARAFGNVVHECIELLSVRVAAGGSPGALRSELPSWSMRVQALLRADGLSAATVTRLAREVITALENMLRDPDGQWLLAAHSAAASEFSLTVAAPLNLPHPEPASPVSVRVDRIFRAGPAPHAPGSDHLWIVDYKTASHSAHKVDQFLDEQRSAYAPQLEAYARLLAPVHQIAVENVRLALYLPALETTPRLLWWRHGFSAEESAAVNTSRTANLAART